MTKYNPILTITKYTTQNGRIYWIGKNDSGYYVERCDTIIKGSFTSMMNAKCFADWHAEGKP